MRTYEGRIALVVLNFTDKDIVFRLPVGEGYSGFKLVFGNYLAAGVVGDASGEILKPSRGDKVALRAYEGRVYISDDS